jgi:plasmid replication initiation protein
MLKTLRRDTGGGEYEGLANALNRLQSTTVKTNIRTVGRREHTFSWIDSYSQVVDPSGKIRGMKITLAKWFYDGVLMDGGVLTIDPAYFEIKGGVMRWLYRVARKHAGGNGANGFTISMPTLYEKSGSESPYRRFKFEMLKLARENGLPGFELEIIEHSAKEPSIKMVRRGANDAGEVEYEAVRPVPKRPARKKVDTKEPPLPSR